MKALVTGANGHIGSNLVRALVDRGYSVRATARSRDDIAANPGLASLGSVEFVELDVRDSERFRNLCEQIDTLFYVTTSRASSQGDAISDEDIVADNVKGAESAIRAAARQVDKVVFTSSIAAVPLRRPTEAAATEADWQADLSVPYFRAKTNAERRAWELADKYAVNLVTVLPGAVCGPGFMRGTSSTKVIEAIMLGALRLAAPRMNFPIVDVRDVVRAQIMAAEQNVAGRFLICGDMAPSLKELTQMMHAIEPKVPAALMTMPDFMGTLLPYFDWINSKLHDSPRMLTPELVEAMLGRRFNASNARARSELGWSPEIPIEQTLADTMATIRALRQGAGRKV